MLVRFILPINEKQNRRDILWDFVSCPEISTLIEIRVFFTPSSTLYSKYVHKIE